MDASSVLQYVRIMPQRLHALALLACFAPGCGDDDDGTTATDTAASSTGASTAGEQDTTSTTGMSPTGSDGANTTAMGTGGTTSGSETSETSETGTSSSPDTTTRGGTTDPGTTTMTELGGPYDPCDVDQNCGPDLRCSQSRGYCTPDCADAEDCPIPETGDATIGCTQGSRGSLCWLSCSVDTTTCPDGMFCNDEFPGPPPGCEYP